MSRAWLAVAASVFAAAWGGNEFTPLLVMYRESGDFSAVVVDSFLFAYVLGIIPALLIGGPLSDRFGRRPLMVPAPVIAAAGSTMIAFGAGHAATIVAGRVMSGVALGLAMAVGGSWIKELSTGDAGARRAAMSLTSGFAVGAGVAGILGQWAPWPTALAFVVHVGIAAVAFALVLRVPETVTALPVGERGRLIDDLKIPAVGHRRFLCVVLPVAPWVFGAASVAYAVLPDLMTERSGGLPIAFSALLCVVALGSGFGIQALARRIDTPDSARGSIVALSLLVVGMLAASLAAAERTVPLALAAAAILGCGYGMALVGGLQEVGRIAGPRDLAGLSAVFYSVTYLGFAVPALLAVAVQEFPRTVSYPLLFSVGAGLAAACLVWVGVNSKK